MNRRFVNVLVNKWRAARPAFQLHRIDHRNLFYPTGSPEPAEIMHSPPAPARGRLPSASISFDWPYNRHQLGWIDFMAFKNSIVAVDHEGRSVLYDSAARAVLRTNPMKPSVQSNNMFVTVGDSLYVMSSCARSPSERLSWFCALVYGKPPDFFGLDDWYWRSLKLPPFDHAEEADADRCSDADDGYSDDDDRYTDDEGDDDESPHPCAVSAFAVVGDSHIWVSTAGAGTYSFDTASRRWSKVGAWALPFTGRAVHLPEHSLWFGLSENNGYQLCAADLLAQTPPVQHAAWEDTPPPEVEAGSVTLTATRLLPLGSGRLCVARLFQDTEKKEHETLVVATGVEVRRRGAGGIRDLQVIRHKSRRYSFGSYDDVRLL